MRLAIASSEFPPGPGGIGQHAAMLADRFARRGHEVLALAPQDYAEAREVSAFNDGLHHRIHNLRRPDTVPETASAVVRRWRGLRDLRIQLADFEPELVIASGQSMLIATAYFVRPPRWIAVAHGSELQIDARVTRRMTRRALHRSAAVVSVSEFTNELVGSLVPDSTRVVIHNGADEHRFNATRQSSDHRESLGLGGVPMALSVGQVSTRKGQDVVVEALGHLRRTGFDVHYVVAGLSTEAGRLRRIASRCGVADLVHIAGLIPNNELAGLYQDADVFLMTSRRTEGGDVEGFGIAVIEAALSGTPAIVAGQSGLAETVVHESTGFVVPPDDPESTARYLRRILVSPELRDRLGREAMKRAEADYTWTSVADRYLDLIESISHRSLR